MISRAHFSSSADDGIVLDTFVNICDFSPTVLLLGRLLTFTNCLFRCCPGICALSNLRGNLGALLLSHSPSRICPSLPQLSNEHLFIAAFPDIHHRSAWALRNPPSRPQYLPLHRCPAVDRFIARRNPCNSLIFLGRGCERVLQHLLEHEKKTVHISCKRHPCSTRVTRKLSAGRRPVKRVRIRREQLCTGSHVHGTQGAIRRSSIQRQFWTASSRRLRAAERHDNVQRSEQ